MNIFSKINQLLVRGVGAKQAGLFYDTVSQPTLQHEVWIRTLMKESRKNQDVMMTPLLELDYMSLDSETTGFHAETDHILSLAAVPIKEGEVDSSKYYYTLVNPGVSIPPFISELTGIRDEDVSTAPSLQEVIHSFLRYLGDRMIIGYYVGHDIQFLNHFLWCHYRLRLTHRVLETKKVFDLLFPEVQVQAMEDVLAFMKIEVSCRHHALYDAQMTAILWVKLIKELNRRGIKTLGELYHYLATGN